MSKLLIFEIFLTIFCSIACTQDKKDIFDDKSFYDFKSKNDYDNYISCLRIKGNSSCSDLFDTLENRLLRSPSMSFSDGTRSKLTSFTSDITEILRNKQYKKFLAVSIFLDDKEYISRKLLDTMLEYSLRLDSTNIIANFELAKLRYKENYIGLSHFLIDNLNRFYPDNTEIKRLKNQLDQQFGVNSYDKSMNYNEYLNLNPHYIDPNE